MDLLKSFALLLWGIIKRLYYLVPSLFTDPFDFMERWFQVTYQPPLFLFWLLLTLGILVAVVLTFHELRVKATRETSLVFSGVGWENVQAPLMNSATGQVIGTPVFTHAIFSNDPEDSRRGVTAEKVVAHLEFSEFESRRILFKMIGRWSETPERAQVGARVVETNQIDIAPNAMPRTLDIVIKYDDEDDCYGLNNDTPNRAPRGWRDEGRKLPPGSYSVKIRLRGNNIDQEFWLGLKNEGVGKRIWLSPMITG
jgi:hypothetical protein